MSSSPEAFARAWQFLQERNFSQAEQIYRQLLQTEPTHVDSWCCLGMVLAQQGKIAEAAASFAHGVRCAPDHVDLHNNLGLALTRQGKAAEAIPCFQTALRLRPGYAAAHYNLAVALRQLGQLDEAVAHYRQALRDNPDYAEVHCHLGIALAEQGQLAEAIARFQTALRLRPGYADAHYNLGCALTKHGDVDGAIAQYQQAVWFRPAFAEAHFNLGNVLRQKGRTNEALASYRLAVQLQPESAMAHHNLAFLLAEQGDRDAAVAGYRRALSLQPDYGEAQYHLGGLLFLQEKYSEAICCYQQVLRLKPAHAEAHYNLGLALGQEGKLDEAVASYQQALRLQPGHLDARNNLGRIREIEGKFDEAEACYREVLRRKPEFAEVNFNLALLQLRLGDFARGWPGYEWRWKKADNRARSFSQPLWDGSPLAGRTILLHAEQGLGDTLQFLRYVPLVKQRGGTVLLEVQEAALPLASGCAGLDGVQARGKPLPPFHVHAPLLSLPAIFGTSLATIPVNIPYLFPDATLVAQWRREFAAVSGFKVGIAWQGSSTYRGDRYRDRSAPLAEFAPLAAVEGVRLFSLQKGPGTEELRRLAGQVPISDLSDRLDEDTGPFMDTAAVMRNLDLVVTVDTAIPNLAGALGVPVWVALPYMADWRWLLDREDSPWYPSMRLFRQGRDGHWRNVFERMAGELNKLLADRSASSPSPATR